jgi:membrane-associated protease RseP (regulator of RpoE activity)
VLQVLVGGSRIGVTLADVQPADVTRHKLSGQRGAIVTDVSVGMPAEKAGIKNGDVIVEFDSEAVRSVSQLTRMIRETPAGRAVKVAVVRDGKRMDFTVTPQDGPYLLMREIRFSALGNEPGTGSGDQDQDDVCELRYCYALSGDYRGVSALDFNNGITLQGFRIPSLITRRAKTDVELRDGQSFAIAGLLDNITQEDRNASRS